MDWRTVVITVARLACGTKPVDEKPHFECKKMLLHALYNYNTNIFLVKGSVSSDSSKANQSTAKHSTTLHHHHHPIPE